MALSAQDIEDHHALGFFLGRVPPTTDFPVAYSAPPGTHGDYAAGEWVVVPLGGGDLLLECGRLNVPMGKTRGDARHPRDAELFAAPKPPAAEFFKGVVFKEGAATAGPRHANLGTPLPIVTSYFGCNSPRCSECGFGFEQKLFVQSKASGLIHVRFLNWHNHDWLAGPATGPPIKITRYHHRQSVSSAAVSMSARPSGIIRGLRETDPNNPLQTKPVAVAPLMKRKRAGLRLNLPPHEAVHAAIGNPETPGMAQNVVMYWPVQVAGLIDLKDERGHCSALLWHEGCEDDILQHGRHGVQVDAAVSGTTTGYIVDEFVITIPLTPNVRPASTEAQRRTSQWQDVHGLVPVIGAPKHHTTVPIASAVSNTEE